MKFQLGYRPEIDGIRALAVLAVMLYHLQGFPLVKGGHVGVDVFFVLSGFLITSLLLSEWEANGRIDLKAFYIRRTLRLLPALLAVVAALLLFTLLLRNFDELRGHVRDFHAIPEAALVALTYSSNWLMALQGAYLGPLSHTWSLAIEEQFYVIWPVLLVLLLRRGISLSGLTVVLVVAVIGVGLWRFALWSEVGVHRAYFGADARADTLLLGCLVAVLAHRQVLSALVRGAGPLVPLAALVMLLYAALFVSVRPAPIYYGAGTLIGACAAVCLAYVVAAPRRGLAHSLLSRQPLMALGRISYGLYLWHVPVYFFVDGTSAVAWGGQILMSLALAVLSYRLVERPALRLKNRFARHGDSSRVEPAHQELPEGDAGKMAA